MTDFAFLDRARAIAYQAHEGQVDKAGAPYIGHPERIASKIFYAGHSIEAEIVGWLHDVVEDCPEWPLSRLQEEGFSVEVLEAVEAISHRKNEPRVDYYRRVKANGLALQVKGFDLNDHTEPGRLALLSASEQVRLQAKYAKARAILFDHPCVEFA